MSDKIPLPIELHPSIKSNLFSVIFGGGIFWLGHIVNDIANEIFIVIIAVLCMMIGVILLP